jgi:hypothetical protein
LAGGLAGAPACAEVETARGSQPIRKVSQLPLAAGDRAHLHSGEGGGYGPPEQRDLARDPKLSTSTGLRPKGDVHPPLPELDRRLIESLKPYKGGNQGLWALHHFDILRKHRRLLSVGLHPISITLQGTLKEGDFEPLAVEAVHVNEETIIGMLRTDAGRQCVIAGDARIWRTWNFTARGRGNTPGDIMGSLIKRASSAGPF